MANGKITRSRAPRNDLTAEFVRSRLGYDPDTGVLSWKLLPPGVIYQNNTRAGKPVNTVNRYGYITVRICGHVYSAHRIIWVIMTGVWPSAEIDHISGKRSDNRWLNLREATRIENCRNAGIGINNTSGHKGVCWQVRHKKWRAVIMVNRRSKFLGYFNDVEAASRAYQEAAAELFGEFRRSA